jgi:hypothetical protein
MQGRQNRLFILEGDIYGWITLPLHSWDSRRFHRSPPKIGHTGRGYNSPSSRSNASLRKIAEEQAGEVSGGGDLTR